MDESELSPVEHDILLFFGEHDIVLNPASLAANIDYDRNYTARRCNELARHGLLEKLDGPKYRLTEAGRAFVGSLNTRDK